MGDHAVEFGRIFYYRDELLGTNPGTNCLVKLGEANEEGHNKRGCPHIAPSAEAKPNASSVATSTGSGRGRGRPKKTPTEATTVAPQAKNNSSGRGRGRPKKTPPEETTAAPQGKTNSSVRERGRPKKTSSEDITEPPQEKKERGRPKRTISVGATATPLPTAPPVPIIFPASSSAPPDFCASSSIAETTKRGMSSGRKNTGPFKRQRIVEMSLGMPSCKIYSTGQAKVARSADVTGDIGYAPSSTTKLKWNDKSAISTRNYNNLKRIEERRLWEVAHTNQVNITLLHSPRCHGNCSDVDVF
ncbi:hypothetical protein P3S67_012120 [Capsicum chacoense]